MNRSPESNRQSGPKRVLDIASARVKGPYDRIEDHISTFELVKIVASYWQIAGRIGKVG